VARTVFKIAEVVARRLVGSIPTRSRQSRPSTRTNRCQAFQEAYNARPACVLIEIAPAQREKFTATQAGTDCHRDCAAELELLALIDVKGTLYGTTEEGTQQHGKVFLLKP